MKYRLWNNVEGKRMEQTEQYFLTQDLTDCWYFVDRNNKSFELQTKYAENM